VLFSFELPYPLQNAAKGSPRRPVFAERSWRERVPYLHEPNAEADLSGAGRIVAHLEAAYAR
jgi:hypothetical protein